ncbi:MAG: hypothetical protein IJ762_00215 [Bacteroidaceae bacterium]|nr:hypothetical protein [Bacteroidaceae bacterium]
MKRNVSSNSNHSLPSGRVWGRGRIGVVFFFALLLAGCTLSMEDWVLSEEERGIEEPYTEHTEYGDVTYQFRDSVLPVTDRIQEDYIVRVEHDSILYFNGGIPGKWRPYVGMKLSAGCSHTLPYGLNHKVLSVEDVGGILKVVTTKVETEEVFKQLDYCLDAGLGSVDVSAMSEEEMLDYGYQLTVDPETGDTLVMDWNNYDVEKGLRPAGAKRKSLKAWKARKTRSEEDNTIDGNKSLVDETVYFDFTFDTRDLDAILSGAKLAKEFKKSILDDLIAHKNKGFGQLGNFYAGVGLKIASYSHSHMEKNDATETNVQYVDTWTETTVKVEDGFEKSNSSDSNYDKDRVIGVPGKKFMEQIKEQGKLGQKLENITGRKQKWNNLTIRIILPVSFPCALIIGSEVTPTIDFTGSVCASCTFASKKTRAGHEIRNGKLLHEWKNETVEKEGHRTWKAALNGSLKIGASYRASVGIEFAGTFSTSIGLNVDAFAEAKGSIELSTHPSEAYGATNFYPWGSITGTFNASVDIYGDIQAAVAPFGITLWNKQVAKFLNKNIFSLTGRINPVFDYVSGNEVLTSYGADEKMKIYGYYSFKDMGLGNAFISTNSGRPGMKIYFGPVSSKTKWEYMQPYSEDAREYMKFGNYSYAKEKERYAFLWEGNPSDYMDLKNGDGMVHLVPVLWTWTDYYKSLAIDAPFSEIQKYMNTEMPFNEKKYPIDVRDANIFTWDTGQLRGESSFDFAAEEEGNYISTGEGGELRHITFYTSVIVGGGSRMKAWGLSVKLWNSKGRIVKGSAKTLNVNKLRSGTYTFIFDCLTNWKPKDENDKLYYSVCPFWYDKDGYDGVHVASDNESQTTHELQYDFYDKDKENALNNKKGSVYGTIEKKDMQSM